MKNLINTINVPSILITNHLELDLSDEELLVILKLMAINQLEVDLELFLKSSGINLKDLVLSLVKKKFLTLDSNDGKPKVLLNPIYEKLLHDDLDFMETIKQETPEKELSIKSNELTKNFLLQIKDLIERDLTSIEIDDLQTWIKDGYNQEEIYQAIIQAVSRNVDNFKYIEKILNNKQPLCQDNDPDNFQLIDRNWTL